jgi:hypothetical protein
VGRHDFDWKGIPHPLRDRVAAIVHICDHVCDDALDDEYRAFAHRAVARLARKRPSPLVRGDTAIWAGGVLHALGQVNFLFASRSPLHVTAGELAALAGANPSSAAQKAKVVRETLRMRDLDPEFTRNDILALGPAAGLARYGIRAS